MDRNRYNVNSPLKIICDGRPGTPRRPRGAGSIASPCARRSRKTDRRDALHERDQGLAVMQVGPGNADGDRQTGAFRNQVDLRAVLAPVDRIRTCQVPLFRARMFTESIAHRDQSSSPRAPCSSRTRRWSLAHTLAFDHCENRRWAVAPDGPNDAEGSCCQVQPDVATNTIAASTSRSPCRRRPPPGGRDGASGITRWKMSSRRCHSASVTQRCLNWPVMKGGRLATVIFLDSCEKRGRLTTGPRPS